MKRIFGVMPLQTQVTRFNGTTIYTEDDNISISIGDTVVYDGGDGLYIGTIDCMYRTEVGTSTRRLLVSKIDTSMIEKEKKKQANMRKLEEIMAAFPDAITIIKEYLNAKHGK